MGFRNGVQGWGSGLGQELQPRAGGVGSLSHRCCWQVQPSQIRCLSPHGRDRPSAATVTSVPTSPVSPLWDPGGEATGDTNWECWGWGAPRGLGFTWGHQLCPSCHTWPALSSGSIPQIPPGTAPVPWVSPELSPPCPGDSSPRAQSSWLKLLHINATARLETPGYQGPFLPPEALGGDRDKDKSKDKDKATPLQRGLREALPGALGGHELVRYDVSTVYGWDIGECHLLPPAGLGTCLCHLLPPAGLIPACATCCHPRACHLPWAPSCATPWLWHPPCDPQPCHHYLPVSLPPALSPFPVTLQPTPALSPSLSPFPVPSSPLGCATPLSPPCSPVKFGP